MVGRRESGDERERRVRPKDELGMNWYKKCTVVVRGEFVVSHQKVISHSSKICL